MLRPWIAPRDASEAGMPKLAQGWVKRLIKPWLGCWGVLIRVRRGCWFGEDEADERAALDKKDSGCRSGMLLTLYCCQVTKSYQSQLNINPRLLELLKDAEKFVLSHGSIIAQAPLQTYGSALVFSPTLSEIRKQYWEERLPFIEMTAGIRDHWGAHRQTLEGHGHWVSAVAFSPDGKTLASASEDYRARYLVLASPEIGSRTVCNDLLGLGIQSFRISCSVLSPQTRVDARHPSLIPIDHVSQLGLLGCR